MRSCFAVLTAAVLLGGCGSEEVSGVEVAEVKLETVSEVVEAPASVAAKASATVTAPATGRVSELFAEDGDVVSPGALLLRIDSPEAQERLRTARRADERAAAGTPRSPGRIDLGGEQRRLDKAAEDSFSAARVAARQLPDPAARDDALAEVAQAEASYRSARAASQAAVRTFNSGLRSLDDTVSALAQTQRVQTRAAVRLAERTVEDLTVRAPIAGTVNFAAGGAGAPAPGAEALDSLPESVRGQAEQLLGGAGAGGGGSNAGTLSEGSVVSRGAPLLSVTDVSALSLVAEVDETDVLLVKPGVKAEVELDAVPGASYDATVTSVAVSPAASGGAGSVAYPVRLSLGAGRDETGKPAPAPRPGMSAVTRLRVRTESGVPAVPSAAVFRDGGRDAVWVEQGGVARKRLVRLGAQGDDLVQIAEGLRAGERVVVKGQAAVADGQSLP